MDMLCDVYLNTVSMLAVFGIGLGLVNCLAGLTGYNTPDAPRVVKASAVMAGIGLGAAAAWPLLLAVALAAGLAKIATAAWRWWCGRSAPRRVDLW